MLSLLVGLGLWAAPAASAAAPAGAGGLRVGLEGAAFKDFLLFMGQFTGKNPVFRQDQLPDATVILVARQSVDEAELAEMQALVLRVAGLAAIPRGELVYLLPEQGHPVQPPGPTQILAQRLGPGLEPGQAASVLERLRSDAGQIAFGPGHWLVLRDQAERVARARAVLTALEAAPAGSVLELMPLGRAEARLAARKLDMHFRGLPGPAPVVLALEWSNTMLLAGSADQLDQARHLLARVDEGGREAPALRAFRLRYAKADKVAGAIREQAASDKRMGDLRVSVDDQAGAVVVLAEPELMARVERLVADLDQPKPRVLVEALVLELPAKISERGALLAVFPAPVGVAAPANPPAAAPAGARAYAQAAVGTGLRLRGDAVGNAVTGPAALDALAGQLAQDSEVRVLARPRAAVPDGGEMRLGLTRPEPAGAKGAGPGAEVERQRLVFTPLQNADGTQVNLRVSLDEVSAPGRQQVAEALLPEGALLLLISQELGSGGQTGEKGQAGPTRLGVILVTRVVRNAQSASGTGRSLGEAKP
jgi:general secretion pathway protein D